MYKQYTLVFGTSADPIHAGHIDLVVEASKALQQKGIALTQVMVVPVYRRNPIWKERKGDLPLTFEQRFAMCELAAEDISHRLQGHVVQVFASRLEEKLVKSLEKPNYTARTLEVMREVVSPQTGFVFLLGEDAVSGEEPLFGQWYQVETIIQLALLALCPRPGYVANQAFIKELQTKGAQLIRLDGVVTRDIASSQIKIRLADGEDPLRLHHEGLLSEAIALYIKDHDLAATWGESESAGKE